MPILNKDEMEKIKKEKQLAILRASNELLEQAKDTIMSTDKLTDFEKTERIQQIDDAKSENVAKGRTYLQSSKSDIDNASYGEVDEEMKLKYKKRLEARGLTDEQVHQKESATVTIGKDGLPKKKRKRKRGGDDEDVMEIVRVENEEELMRKTMIKDDKDFEQRVGKKIMEENKKDDSDPLKVKEILKNKKVEQSDARAVNVSEVKEETDKSSKKLKKETNVVTYDFDFSTIPSYIQYDVIPLPSNGECYPIDSPLRCGRVPVAYLTASDENIIASPNMYRDGKIIDVILERKILDKRIDVSELCRGDRDAIALWLRATGYGNEFPIVVRNPNNQDKQYDTVIDLSQLNYLKFYLEGDENGLFDYFTENNDNIKFKIPTKHEEDELKDIIAKNYVNINQYKIFKCISDIKYYISDITDFGEFDKEELMLDIEEIFDWSNENVELKEDLINNSITERMIKYTVSINGNEDKEYIRGYIENMRTLDAYKYRKYLQDNEPGVDFKITINVPESDGGGSFDTFLRIDDTIFLNI